MGIPPLDAGSAARAELVVDRLRAAAGPSGFLPFDRFMEITLYEREVGFYEQRRSPLGRAGDFYTAAHVDPIFAASVAARVRSVRASLPAAQPFLIVELGPGDGELAKGVVRSLPGELAGVEYVLIDRSLARLDAAEERLRSVAGGPPVRRAGSVGELGPFSGVVLANEFLDAQPARRLRWDGVAWHEGGVRVTGGRVGPAEEPLSRPVPGPALPTPEAAGTVLEFSPLAEGTVREIGDHLGAGVAILLDYGMDESELLRGHPHGTLAAVRDHRSLPDPFDAPGTADLSVFVNFTRVRRVAEAAGLRELAFRSQAEALGAWGFSGLLESGLRAAGSSEAKVRLQLAAKNLLFGFDRFRVLELGPSGAEDARAPAT
ncbi:MAG: SAM-dependent methyltransferase [Thermoplasmata archaeon]